MKIELLVSRAGPAGAQNRGDVIEVSDTEAKRMFEAQPPQAVPHVEKNAGVERRHPFDHDADGKPGGSKSKKKRG